MTEARQFMRLNSCKHVQSFIDFCARNLGQYYFRKTNIWVSMAEARQEVKCF